MGKFEESMGRGGKEKIAQTGKQRFEELMKGQKMEGLAKTEEQRFKDLMEGEELGHLIKPETVCGKYILKVFVTIEGREEMTDIESFDTKKERDDYCETIKESAELYGNLENTRIVFEDPEEPGIE